MGSDEMKQLGKYKDNLLEKNNHPFHKKTNIPKMKKMHLHLIQSLSVRFFPKFIYQRHA